MELPPLQKSTAPTIPRPSTKKKHLFPKIILGIFVFLASLTCLIFFFVFLPAKKLATTIGNTRPEIDKIKALVADKDLPGIENELGQLRLTLTDISHQLSAFAYLRPIPYLKNYYADSQRLVTIAQNSLDAGNIVISAVKPYQDFLGLKGAASSSAKTTEDRITFLTQSVENLLPNLDALDQKISTIQTNLNQIDVNRYPATIRDLPLRQYFLQANELISELRLFVTNGRPLLAKTSWLLGKDKPRNYLVVFQNDGELRPSGGFWTAYATLQVNNGKVIPGQASNIYDLDDKLQSTTPAPRIIKSYHINVPYLNLRDSNLSPDFPTDGQIFLDGYYKAMGKKTKFDAVVALDTNLLLDLVNVLGKLDTRVGTFTTKPDKRCDGCPQIIYELEWISGRPRNYIEKNRKDFWLQ